MTHPVFALPSLNIEEQVQMAQIGSGLTVNNDKKSLAGWTRIQLFELVFKKLIQSVLKPVNTSL